MYSQPITHTNRTAFIIAIDCSSSMQFNTQLNSHLMSKAEAVAMVCNYLVDELLARATRGGKVRNYYDIAVIGYTGSDVVSLLSDNIDEFTPITELAKRAPKTTTLTFNQINEEGTTTSADFALREWVKPMAEGRTPMYAALAHIYKMVKEWCSARENRESFPPIVFNITDGEANDASTKQIVSLARNITELGTLDGKTLLINVHLGSSEGQQSEIFPSESDFRPLSQYHLMLFLMSSLMPKEMEPLLSTIITHSSPAPYRALAYNASPCELLSILNIGSESINIV